MRTPRRCDGSMGRRGMVKFCSTVFATAAFLIDATLSPATTPESQLPLYMDGPDCQRDRRQLQQYRRVRAGDGADAFRPGGYGIMLSRAIPVVAVGPLAGVVLDRFDRKQHHDCQRPGPRRRGAGIYLGVTRRAIVAALSVQRIADACFAIFHRRPLGESCRRSPATKNCTPPIPSRKPRSG